MRGGGGGEEEILIKHCPKIAFIFTKTLTEKLSKAYPIQSNVEKIWSELFQGVCKEILNFDFNSL